MVDTIEKLPASTKLFVDPIMADNGKLYSGCIKNMLKPWENSFKMLMWFIPHYRSLSINRYPIQRGKSWLFGKGKLAKEPADLGPWIHHYHRLSWQRRINRLSTWPKETDAFLISQNKVSASFYGTGDTLAALATACILQEMSIERRIVIHVEIYRRSASIE